MSKKFNIISFVLIVILIIILIMVMFNYFTRENVVNIVDRNSYNGDTNITHIIPSGNNDTDVPKDNFTSVSGESIININESGDIYLESGDIKSESGDVNLESGDNSGDVKQVTMPTQITNNGSTSVIISSNDEISNKEKKQVLKELDQTLMELLDVVDKVQTVDESRLTTEESEGQKWKK